MPLQPLLTLLSLCAGQAWSADDYTAAVVEYAALDLPANTSADLALLLNAKVYRQYMANASAHKVDIIVFPESGLRRHGLPDVFLTLPAPDDRVAPCDYDSTVYHPALILLSCAARQLRLYTVVNLSELSFNRTSNHTARYNTNIALDRNGTLVARYRKYHPYGEAVDTPAEPDHHVFTTDFGVSFALFICFDLEFREPALVMATRYGVRHFVLSLCWQSELPFLTAAQAQWGWSYSLNVALLAAGCNRPSAGGGGSGIFVGRQGPLDYIQTNAHMSKMLIASVPIEFGNETGPASNVSPKEPGVNNPNSGWSEAYLFDEDYPSCETEEETTDSALFMLRDYLDVYRSELLLPPRGSQDGDLRDSPFKNTSVSVTLITETTLCQNSFCCDFQVQMTNTFGPSPPPDQVRGDDFSRLFYRLVVFDGVRWYGGGLATGGVQVCGVVGCANESLTSCGLRADDPHRHVARYSNPTYGALYKTGTVFESISITANFYYNDTFVFPDLLVTGSGNAFGSLVPSDGFGYETFGPYNDSLIATLRVVGPLDGLVTAALYARQFDRDGEPRTEVSSVARPRPYSVLALCLLALFIFRSALPVLL